MTTETEVKILDLLMRIAVALETLASDVQPREGPDGCLVGGHHNGPVKPFAICTKPCDFECGGTCCMPFGHEDRCHCDAKIRSCAGARIEPPENPKDAAGFNAESLRTPFPTIDELRERFEGDETWLGDMHAALQGKPDDTPINALLLEVRRRGIKLLGSEQGWNEHKRRLGIPTPPKYLDLWKAIRELPVPATPKGRG